MSKRLALLFAVAGVLGFGSSAQAATITVDTTVDSFDVPGQCSLRSAVYAADRNIATGGCPAGTSDSAGSGWDRVQVPGGRYELTLTGAGEGDGKTGDLDISGRGALSIEPVDAKVKVIVDGVGSDRILDIASPSESAAIYAMTFTNGKALGASPNGGGAIRVTSAGLNAYDMLVVGNQSESDGGGFLLDGSTVTIFNSTVSGNEAAGSGGGIHGVGSDEQGEAYGNLRNVTIALNTADADADGSGNGGGLSLAEGRAGTMLANAILADNRDDTVAPGLSAPDCYVPSAEDAQARNVISTQAFTPGVCGMLVPPLATLQAPVDPMLEPLADNGGQTFTHAIDATSPAVGAGISDGFFNMCLAYDQRGVLRPLLACDLGAFQLVPGRGIAKPSGMNAVLSGGSMLKLKLRCPAKFRPACSFNVVAMTGREGKRIAPPRKVKVGSGSSKVIGFVVKEGLQDQMARLADKAGKFVLKTRLKARKVNNKKMKRQRVTWNGYSLYQQLPSDLHISAESKPGRR